MLQWPVPSRGSELGSPAVVLRPHARPHATRVFSRSSSDTQAPHPEEWMRYTFARGGLAPSTTAEQKERCMGAGSSASVSRCADLPPSRWIQDSVTSHQFSHKARGQCHRLKAEPRAEYAECNWPHTFPGSRNRARHRALLSLSGPAWLAHSQRWHDHGAIGDGGGLSALLLTAMPSCACGRGLASFSDALTRARLGLIAVVLSRLGH